MLTTATCYLLPLLLFFPLLLLLVLPLLLLLLLLPLALLPELPELPELPPPLSLAATLSALPDIRSVMLLKALFTVEPTELTDEMIASAIRPLINAYSIEVIPCSFFRNLESLMNGILLKQVRILRITSANLISFLSLLMKMIKMQEILFSFAFLQATHPFNHQLINDCLK